MNKVFLTKLYDCLEPATVREMQTVHDFFVRYHVWDWLSPEHVKALCWLRSQRDGEFDSRQISASISVVGPQGQLWPGPEQIPRIIAGLQQLKLIWVTWGKQGSRETQAFHLELDPLHRETKGHLWDRFGEVIADASFKEIQALAALYAQTNLAEQPGFYLRSLTWAATRGTGEVSNDELTAEFGDIYRAVKFAHDRRNPQHALFWCKTAGLLGVTYGAPGEAIRLDVSPLTRFGFEVNQTNKGGKHE